MSGSIYRDFSPASRSSVVSSPSVLEPPKWVIRRRNLGQMERVGLYSIIRQRPVFKNVIVTLDKLWNFNLPFLYVLPEVLQPANVLDLPV